MMLAAARDRPLGSPCLLGRPARKRLSRCQVEGPIAEGLSHRTAGVPFAYGTSGLQAINPAVGRVTTSRFPMPARATPERRCTENASHNVPRDEPSFIPVGIRRCSVHCRHAAHPTDGFASIMDAALRAFRSYPMANGFRAMVRLRFRCVSWMARCRLRIGASNVCNVLSTSFVRDPKKFIHTKRCPLVRSRHAISELRQLRGVGSRIRLDRPTSMPRLPGFAAD